MWLAPPELSAAERKSVIGGARLCVASRTHACVAAYSSCVPALAIGYSVKSAGIAADLGQEDFVLDAAALDARMLLDAFHSLRRQERTVPETLTVRIPAYTRSVVSSEILNALR